MAALVGYLKTGFAKLRQTEDVSDCKVICGPYHYNLHKAILSSQSEFFRIAFKPGTFKEGESNVLELKVKDGDTNDEDCCDDPEIFKLMIEYISHFNYLRGVDSDPREDEKTAEISFLERFMFGSKTYLVVHAKVFAIGAKYDMKWLCKVSAAKFKKAASFHWKDKEFKQAIPIVYTSTTEDFNQLRDIVVTAIHADTDVFKADNVIEGLVSSMPGLAYALLKLSREAYEDERLLPTVVCEKVYHRAKAPKDIRVCVNCKESFRVCRESRAGGFGFECEYRWCGRSYKR